MVLLEPDIYLSLYIYMVWVTITRIVWFWFIYVYTLYATESDGTFLKQIAKVVDEVLSEQGTFFCLIFR